jgi:predicted Zn-ribbon and HTH transcriptional regulator
MNSYLLDKNERLEKAKNHAISKGGKCLSDEYINAEAKMKWKCNKCDTIWDASWKNISYTSWCPKCGGKKSTDEMFKEVQEYCLFQKGECLSDKYINGKTKLEFKCFLGHKWFANPNHVLNSPSWCPQCAKDNNINLNGLKIAQEYAKSKDGECLSTEYLGAKKKLKWKCENNHIWESEYRNTVSTKTWCAKCSAYYYKEHKIRNLLEYLIGHKFEKSRPNWNINPKTNKKLELDGFCEELKIAFEFQGKHHYDFTAFYTTQEELDYVKYKDEVKKQHCINNGVNLIIIDDKFKLSETNKIVDYVISILEQNNIYYNKKYDIKKIADVFANHTNHQAAYLEKAKTYAISKNGFCLSKEYINSEIKLKWRCAEGHEWLNYYYNVVGRGRWCRQCYLNSVKKKKSD